MAQRTRPAARYRSAHWGIEATQVFEVDDPKIADAPLVEMGKLRGLRIKPQGARSFELAFPRTRQHILAFSPRKDQRLYLIYPTSTAKRLAKRLLVDGADEYELRDVARAAGGRQARYRFRRSTLPVQVLGALTHVIYYTPKGGDEEERRGVEYIHRMGEEGGVEPYLAIDEDGQLWIAGGSYTVPDPGITH